MSEVLNKKVTSGEENGVSRRRVVAGVAWSLPVIATAIAAPAAAASEIFSIAAGQLENINFSKEQGSGNPRTGRGPLILTIQNTSGAAKTVTVGIVPTVNTGTVRTGIAVKSLTGGVVGPVSFDGNHVSTASITISGNQPVNRSIAFYYVDAKGQSTPTSGQQYTFTMTITGVSITPVAISNITMGI